MVASLGTGCAVGWDPEAIAVLQVALHARVWQQRLPHGSFFGAGPELCHHLLSVALVDRNLHWGAKFDFCPPDCRPCRP